MTLHAALQLRRYLFGGNFPEKDLRGELEFGRLMKVKVGVGGESREKGRSEDKKQDLQIAGVKKEHSSIQQRRR